MKKMKSTPGADSGKTELNYPDLFYSVPVGYITVSRNGLITRINHAAIRLFDAASPDDFIGKPVAELVHHASFQAFETNARSAFCDNILVPKFEDVFIQNDGATMDVEVTMIPGIIHGEDDLLIMFNDISERKRVNSALVKARNDWEQTFNAIPDMIAVIDASNRIVKVNKSMADKLGCTTDHLTGCNCFNVLHGVQSVPDICPHISTLQKAAEGESSIEEVLFGRSSDVTSNPTFDAEGNLTSVVYVARDMRLRDKKEQFIFENLALGEFALSHTLMDLLTLTIDKVELLTGSMIGFFHFLDDDETKINHQTWSTNTLKVFRKVEKNEVHSLVEIAGIWADCIRERRPVIHNDYATLNHRTALPKGHAELIRVLTIPIMRGGKIVAVLGVGNKPVNYDETDVEIVSSVANLAWEYIVSKRFEESLNKSEHYSHALFDAIPDLIFRMRRDGVYLDFKAARDDLYYQESSIIGKNNRDITPPFFAELIDSKIKMTLDHKQMVEFEYQLPVAGRGTRYFEARMVPSGLDEVIAISRDITDRKQSEMELKKKIDKLEWLNNIMIDRELKTIELKKEINDLLRGSGREVRYIIHQTTT